MSFCAPANSSGVVDHSTSPMPWWEWRHKNKRRHLTTSWVLFHGAKEMPVTNRSPYMILISDIGNAVFCTSTKADEGDYSLLASLRGTGGGGGGTTGTTIWMTSMLRLVWWWHLMFAPSGFLTLWRRRRRTLLSLMTHTVVGLPSTLVDGMVMVDVDYVDYRLP